MPAIFTHIQFGKEVAQGLPPALKALTERHAESFYAGTQGPDLLFYHKPLKSRKKNPARAKGWALHEVSPEAFFLNAALLLLSDSRNFDEAGNFSPRTAEAAYLLGFLCHFTLDSACHPLIDGSSVNGLTHGKIESELDKFQYRKIGKPDRGFNAAKLYANSEAAKIASSKILSVNEREAAVAMRSMRKINGLFSHKCGLVHGFCHAVLSLVGMNGSFGEMFLHKKDDLRCKELLPKLGELFNAAIPTAREAIVDFFGNMPQYVAQNRLDKDFYRYNYSGVKEKN